MKNKIGVALLSSLVTTTGFAQEEKNEWTGTGELGFVISNGNTDTQTVTSKIAAVRDGKQWRQHLTLTGSGKSDSNVQTAEKYFAEGKLDRKLSDHYYLFGLANYEKDRFSGFDHQANISAGLGRRALEDETITLDIELGLGARFSETDSGDKEDEPILRFAGDFNWKLSETSSFQQTLSIEAGDESSVYKSLTSLDAKVTENISLKASFEAKHTSEVPLGSKNTDTTTSLGLAYKF